jgi:hypothetical protein
MKLKQIMTVSALAMLVASPFAQAKDCSRPSKPAIPDGHTAEEGAMKAANEKLAVFIKGTNEYILCLQDEEKSAAADAKKASADYQEQVKAFNATPAKQ